MNHIDTPKRFRQIEFCLLLCIAVLPLVVTSLFALFTGASLVNPKLRNMQLLYGIITEGAALALLAYFLFRQGRGFADIGLSFRRNDFWISTLLFLATYLAYYSTYVCIHYYYALINGNSLAQGHITTSLDGAINPLVFLFVIVNPFFEELIVRAYCISEFEALWGSLPLAVALSVLLQTVYHLYQGIPNALAEASIFLIFSVYYARTRKIFPVILSHAYMDFLALIFYAHH